jgi:glutathione S-transferase
LTNFCRAVAHAAGKDIEVVYVPEDQQIEVAKKSLTGLYPFLETAEGTISESVAIASFLAHGTPLLGSNNVERA